MAPSNRGLDLADRESDTRALGSGEWLLPSERNALSIEYANVPCVAHQCAIDVRGPAPADFFYDARRILAELGVHVLGVSHPQPDDPTVQRIVVIDPCGLPLATRQRERTRLALVGLAAAFGRGSLEQTDAGSESVPPGVLNPWFTERLGGP